MLFAFRDQSYSALRLRQRHAIFHELFLYVILSANTCAYFMMALTLTEITNQTRIPLSSHLLFSIIRTSQSNNSKLTLESILSRALVCYLDEEKQGTNYPVRSLA